MKFTERTYYHILGFLIFVYVMTQLLKPVPLDWTESFTAEDKIPYGGYLIHELLPELFPENDITDNRAPIFNYTDTTRANMNWIFINTSFGIDSYETDFLLSQVEKGAEVFIAARSFGAAFSDSLKVETEMENPLLGNGSILNQDTTFVSFTNPRLQTETGYPYYRSTTETYFAQIDSSLNYTVLGVNGDEKPNFLRVARGDGFLYLHSNPTLFTNYFIRDTQGAEYAFKALSYLPVQYTIWDEYYKDVNRTGQSVLSYVVSEEHLKWAWYTGLCGLFLFLLFKAKRKQRIIPVIQPPHNTSLEFAHTIGNLYLEKGDHKSMAEKKIHFFYDYIRTHLGLDTNEKNEILIKDISSRSGVNIQDVKALFGYIRMAKDQEELSDREIKLVTQHIDQFYKLSER